jgi:hypothetical protein
MGAAIGPLHGPTPAPPPTHGCKRIAANIQHLPHLALGAFATQRYKDVSYWRLK